MCSLTFKRYYAITPLGRAVMHRYIQTARRRSDELLNLIRGIHHRAKIPIIPSTPSADFLILERHGTSTSAANRDGLAAHPGPWVRARLLGFSATAGKLRRPTGPDADTG